MAEQTNNSIQGAFDLGVLRVIQNIGGTFYKASNSQVRKIIKDQLAYAKGRPNAAWTGPGEIEAFETPFEALEQVIKEIDEAEALARSQ
ncbi:hypothetical protein [Pseudomonas chlororaphis]|uniref:hypothetical protein n=1 Tax=Pseudomonas chlororaphis TaxID=587753 RepID=UPI000F588D51|nr:hypothetical protein [Pseudomonas chlororaphis]